MGNVLFYLFLGSVFLTTPHAVFAQGTNKEIGNLVGIPDGVLVTQQDQQLLFGGCPADMWQYLKSKATSEADQGSGRSLVPRKGEPGITPGLACRLYNFFHYLEKNGCNPKIISAFRSKSVQASMCGSGRSGCAAAGRSCHQYGAAVDVSGCVDKMRSLLSNKGNQFKLHFPYYGPHIQCIEHKTAGASSCAPPNPACGGGPHINFDEIPAEQNQLPEGYTPGTNSDADGSGEAKAIEEIVRNIEKTDAGDFNGGGGSFGGGGATGSWGDALKSLFGIEPQPTEQSNPTNETNTQSIFCSDEFGVCNEQAAVNNLLGNDTVSGSVGEDIILDGEGDDSLVGSADTDTLANAQSCADGVSRNDSACLQVSTQNNVPVVSGVGGGSVQETIQDTPTLSQRVFGTILPSQSGSTAESDFNWQDGSFNNAVHYASFEYHAGTDGAAQLMYQDAYGQWRYRSTGAPVPAGLQTLVFGNDVQPVAVTPGISWESIRTVGSAVANAVLRASFGIPIPFLRL